MYICNCGEDFAPDLAGAWAAKLHAEDNGHRLNARHGEARSIAPPMVLY
jgi:hypothetical protein